MASRVFDTYSEDEDEEMSQFVDSINNGRILVFAIKVFCEHFAVRLPSDINILLCVFAVDLKLFVLIMFMFFGCVYGQHY